LAFHGILHVLISIGTHGASTFASVVRIEVHVYVQPLKKKIKKKCDIMRIFKDVWVTKFSWVKLVEKPHLCK
jgi:hypothetical protein